MERPKTLYALIILWLLLSCVFLAWGYYSLDWIRIILSWPSDSPDYALFSFLFFSNLVSLISWLVFAVLFFAFAYGTYTLKKWVWTSGLIISTIFVVIFALMLASFMTTALLYMDIFSVAGLATVIISLLIDLGIIYCLTRLKVKSIFRTQNGE